eukprot:1147417-Pelagomonas_calceolata.AAC.2
MRPIGGLCEEWRDFCWVTGHASVQALPSTATLTPSFTSKTAGTWPLFALARAGQPWGRPVPLRLFQMKLTRGFGVYVQKSMSVCLKCKPAVGGSRGVATQSI